MRFVNIVSGTVAMVDETSNNFIRPVRPTANVLKSRSYRQKDTYVNIQTPDSYTNPPTFCESGYSTMAANDGPAAIGPATVGTGQ
jgi:hypothetical protein